MLQRDLIGPKAAEHFALDGMAQLDHLLIGERDAKMAMLVGMVAGLGMNVVLVGEPGGGKTTLAVNASRLVDGITDIASIPPLSDLTPQQLVGGKTEMTQNIATEGEEPYVSVTATDIKPIITERTQVIVTNELNRVNPYAVNAVLDGLEAGVIVSSAGTRVLPDLQFGVATMNPAEKQQAVFPVSAATASRHAIGAILGAKKDGTERDTLIAAIWDDWEADPRSMQPVIDLRDLEAIRQRSEHGIATPRSLKEEIVGTIKRTSDRLQAQGIHDADGRLTRQVRRVAKAHATLAGQQTVERRDLQQAMRFVVTARIGMLGSRAAHHGISEEVKAIVNGG